MTPSRFQALAIDYDGTLAHNGLVSSSTQNALRRARSSGLRLILVTGRLLPHLGAVFPNLELFDRLVLENGGVLHDPATGRTEQLGDATPLELARALAHLDYLEVGQVVVASRDPHEPSMRAAIGQLGLDRIIVRNKHALMILPPSIDKATGMQAALDDLHLDLHQAVAVGDAENDEPMLRAAGLGVAVANATDGLKRIASRVTKGARGEGVVELIDRLRLESENAP